MTAATANFFAAYWLPALTAVYTAGVSPAMIARPEDEEEYFAWQLAAGTDYQRLESGPGEHYWPTYWGQFALAEQTGAGVMPYWPSVRVPA